MFDSNDVHASRIEYLRWRKNRIQFSCESTISFEKDFSIALV
jgi:hypothetical protein